MLLGAHTARSCLVFLLRLFFLPVFVINRSFNIRFGRIPDLSAAMLGYDIRIVAVEEFGHIYIIKLERELPMPDTNPYVVLTVGISVFFGFLMVSVIIDPRKRKEHSDVR